MHFNYHVFFCFRTFLVVCLLLTFRRLFYLLYHEEGFGRRFLDVVNILDLVVGLDEKILLRKWLVLLLLCRYGFEVRRIESIGYT